MSAAAINAVPPTGIVPAETKITLGVGDTRSIAGWHFAPEGATSDESITYASSKAKVAKVSADGTVKAVAAGSASIRISTPSGINGIVKIKVLAAPKSITLKIDKTTLGVGETALLSATLPKNTTVSYIFSIDNPSVAAIDGAQLTALAAGTAKITVTSHNGKKSTKAITVLPAPESVSLNRNDVTIGEGDQFTLTASLNEGSAGAYSFASSNDHVSVNADGTVSALSKGDATVTVTTYNGKTADCLVHVVDAPRSITLATPDGRSTYSIKKRYSSSGNLTAARAASSLPPATARSLPFRQPVWLRSRRPARSPSRSRPTTALRLHSRSPARPRRNPSRWAPCAPSWGLARPRSSMRVFPAAAPEAIPYQQRSRFRRRRDRYGAEGWLRHADGDRLQRQEGQQNRHRTPRSRNPFR